MKYKKSKYNYFVPYKDNQTIVYNFYSNYTSLFDEDTLNRYNEDKLTEEEQEELHKRGFLIDLDVDELNDILSRRLQENLNDKTKLYRIWTTSGCNARCFYCFEKDIKVENLTDERADKVIEYITNNINEEDVVTIEWFGGEPLLNINAIEKITKAVKAECEKKNAKYNSLFISNGSLITPEIVDKMENEWNTKNIQITLDGSEEAYNKIKDYYNPEKHNFKNVVDNIMLFKDRKISVSIRLNYTEDNWILDDETRIKRAQDIINALPYLSGGAKNTSHLTDVTPKILVLAAIDGGNHIFMNIVREENGETIFDIDALDEIINEYSDILKTDIFIGLRSGFLKDTQDKIIEYATGKENIQVGTIKEMTDKFAEEIPKLI